MLSVDQIARFRDEGYLIVPGILSDDDLDPVRAEYISVLDAAADDLFSTGGIRSRHDGLSFADRYTALLGECPSLYPYLNISLPLSNDPVPAGECRVHSGPAVFGLLTNSKILDVVESLIGGEILSNPIQHIRLKPPQAVVPDAVADYSNIGATAWHQDHGAVMDEAESTSMVTVWVAVTDAAVGNGCLVAVPGSHRPGHLTLHCPGNNVDIAAENYIPESMLSGATPVPLPVTAGSLVLLDKYVEHAALPNVSDQLRWSFDLRYQPVGEPTGRPAFPSFVARSRHDPGSELTDAARYAAQWEAVRRTMIGDGFDGPIFEQDRWLANAGHPAC